MAALSCEICGGKLIGKPGGLFECDSCGMEYNTDWAKAKIQEIKGTVKVEGTVEVQGSVKVEGPVQVDASANVEALLKRGNMYLEDREWDEAQECFKRVLKIQVECAEAHLGICMSDHKCASLEALERLYVEDTLIINDKNFLRAKKFGDSRIAAMLDGWEEKRLAEEKRRKEEKEQERLRAEAEAAEKANALAAIRKRFSIAQSSVSAGSSHAVGLKSDGTVVAAKHIVIREADFGQDKVFGWRDIVAVAAGGHHTVGLKRDGTVVAAGFNHGGPCDVSGWRDIVAVAAGDSHTVGLKRDGTVVAVGLNHDGRCNVSGWQDIVAVAAGGSHTVGLKRDGTVVATEYSGPYEYGGDKCNVSGWQDIVAVAAGNLHTVGLKSDGTVVSTKHIVVRELDYGQCEVSGWRDIVAVAAGRYHTVGLKSDGTVVAAGLNSSDQREVFGWRDIVAVSAHFSRTVGLKSDGTVVVVGDDVKDLHMSDWKLFDSIDTLEQEREAARFAEEQRQAEKKAALETDRAALQAELTNLKGLFSGMRRKAIETRLAEIETELKGL